jgi:hypothetical protein
MRTGALCCGRPQGDRKRWYGNRLPYALRWKDTRTAVGGAMPRARVPRTAVEYLDVVDKRGIADLQRIFQCSRKDAEDVVLLARPSSRQR